MAVKYDRHYLDDPAACGEPFPEFVAVADEIQPGTVLDLGCGQGRDALVFARRGHAVVGVDLSAVGVEQMLQAAREERLDVEGVVADLSDYRPWGCYDVVVLDRVLHMISSPAARMEVLHRAMDAVAPGGLLLVAEGPKGLAPIRANLEAAQWRVRGTRNRLIARARP